jgi:hypothetical protein
MLQSDVNMQVEMHNDVSVMKRFLLVADAHNIIDLVSTYFQTMSMCVCVCVCVCSPPLTETFPA